jgi:hypothetical protein
MDHLPGYGSVVWALLSALLCFISYCTLQWSENRFTVSDGSLVTDYVISSGLLEYRREVTTTNVDTGDVLYEDMVIVLDCIQLTSQQCDYLQAAQDAGAVAVSSKFISPYRC